MKPFLKFILIGCAFALLIEFQFNILVTGNIGNFIFVLFFYPIYLALVYTVYKFGFKKIFKSKSNLVFFYYLLFGIIGLMFEWFMIGNSPWLNPDASQIGMWSFWVALTVMPVIFLETEKKFQKLKKHIKYYIISYAIITTIIGKILTGDFRLFFIVWFEIIGYTLMNLFYLKYWWIVRKT